MLGKPVAPHHILSICVSTRILTVKRKMSTRNQLTSSEERKQDEHCNISDNTSTPNYDGQSLYLSGWKLHFVTFWLLLSLFVAQMDTSVTSTAILQITDSLGGYEKSSWVFTSYMLTYCGMYPLAPRSCLYLSARSTNNT